MGPSDQLVAELFQALAWNHVTEADVEAIALKMALPADPLPPPPAKSSLGKVTGSTPFFPNQKELLGGSPGI